MIDEIELHLHPDWQEKVVDILITAFPHAQFFASTHSPHVIQTAKPNQIIALAHLDNKVFQRELPNSEFGFQGWSIEEVLTDVMGMEDTRTLIFNQMIKQFQQQIETGDYENATSNFEKINSLLHPQNQLKKLMKFQLAAIKGEKE